MISESKNKSTSVKLLMLALVVAAIAVIGIGLVAVSDDTDAGEKSTPTITEVPTASDIKYGQGPDDIVFTGGAVEYNGTPITGVFKGESLSGCEVGPVSCHVRFDPDDAETYNSVYCDVDLTIKKITQSWTMSDVTYECGNAACVNVEGLLGEPTVTYRLDNTEYAEIDEESGCLSGWTKEGTVTAYADFTATDYYEAGTAYCTVTVEKLTLYAVNFSLSSNYGTYDGKAQAPTVSGYEGYVTQDMITCKYAKDSKSVSASDVKDVGVYAVSIDVAEGSCTKAASDLHCENLVFTIDPRIITVSNGTTAITKIYDGTTDGIELTLGTHYVFKDVVTGESVDFKDNTCTFNSKDVLSANNVTIDDLELNNSNYTISSAELTASISVRDIMITPFSGQTGQYSGYNEPEDAISYTSSNIVDGEEPEFGGSLGIACKDVGVQDITLGGLTIQDSLTFLKSNYALKMCDPAVEYTVTAAPLAIMVIDHTIKYGDEFPARIDCTFAGFKGEDDDRVLKGTMTFSSDYRSDENNRHVGCYEINVSGVTADNYIIDFFSGSLYVQPLEVTVEWSTDSSFVYYEGLRVFTYDGESKVLTPTVTNAKYDDEITVESALGFGDNMNATEYGFYYCLTGISDSSNYTIFESGHPNTSDHCFIAKRSVTITSASDSKLYDGTPLTNDTVTVTGDGFIEGEGATYTVTGSQTEVGTSKNVFTYTLNEGTSADNYEITKVEGDLTVEKLTPVITVKKTSSCPSGSYDVGASTTSGEDMIYQISTGSDIISVSSDGTITAKAVGKATLKIISPENDIYEAGEETFTIEVYDHIHVIIPGKAPTKTVAGTTEGEECSECHKVFVKQESIPATGSETSVIESEDTKVQYKIPNSEDVKTLTVNLAEDESKYKIDLSEEATTTVKGKEIVFSVKAVENIADRYITTMTVDGKEFNGDMNITLPYDPSKGTPSVKWVEGNETMDTISVDKSNGTITFFTTHNSTYAVEYETANNALNGAIVGIVMIATVVLLGLGVCLIYTKKE